MSDPDAILISGNGVRAVSELPPECGIIWIAPFRCISANMRSL